MKVVKTFLPEILAEGKKNCRRVADGSVDTESNAGSYRSVGRSIREGSTGRPGVVSGGAGR